jgi:poly-beta-1,6-N-acetyl-D-glucosamine synthase
MELAFWLSFILILYTYAIYPVILYLVRNKSGTIIDDSKELPKVSMVISAYNEQKVIKDKIQNLFEMDYPLELLEIIIASDASDDETDEISKQYAGARIRYIRYEQRSGKINVLNKTIPLAGNDLIVLCDANSMFEKGALKKLVRGFSDPSVGCICGKLVLTTPDKACGGEIEGVYWRYENFLKNVEGRYGSLLGANGGIYSFRKQLYVPLPSNTVVEDFVFPMVILENGHKVAYEPEAVAYEETSRSLAEEHKRKIRIGAGAYQALFMLLPMLNITKGFPSFAYWSHKVLRWLVPFFMIIILVSNLILAKRDLYAVFIFGQVFIYLFAFLGYMMKKNVGKFKVIHVIYYFVSMNLCLLIGFFKYILNTQTVAWQRSER